MRTHATYRLQVKNDKILTGLDEIRCSNKDTISVTMRWARVWAGGIYKHYDKQRRFVPIHNDKPNISLYRLKGIVIDASDNRN